MVEVFDRARRKVGILQNAYGITEELKINAVNYFSFSLPYDDNKNEVCRPFYYIRYNGGQLYRIMPSQITLNELGDIQYKCEHVLALLIDNVLFGEHIVGNRGHYTPETLQYVLDHQLEKNWILGACDFNREFEYAWEQETLLSALFSVPKPFTDKYMWTFDTNSFPYILNLKRLDENARPQMYIRARKNMLQLVKTSDATSVCTRLYPLGEGEGINQLNITNVNNGVPYIQSPQAYIDKYGVVERVWIDRRYTNEESLYESALAMLEEMQEPFEEYRVEFALLGEDSFDVPEIGKIVEIVDFKKAYITGIRYNYDEIARSTLEIANKPKDVASTIADMQDRQRIEMAYAQGATQFYQDHVYDNADSSTTLLLKLMLPTSMKIVNAVKIDVEVGPFRKPFTVTGGGGGQTISQSNTTSSGSSSESTTSAGGGQTIGQSSNTTTSAGGGAYDSTQSGGGWSDSTSAETISLNTTHGPSQVQRGNATTTGAGEPAHTHKVEVTTYHEHSIDVPAHNHRFYVTAHTHSFMVLPHAHDMAHTHMLPYHTHNMYHWHDISHTHIIPNHTHALNPGISFGGNPTSFDLRINGIKKQTVIGKTLQLDITNMLVDSSRKIPRDTYHRIEILPNDAAYVMLTVNVQGFIQSRGDKTV